jgi:DNA-binding IclR family transcriptional regulator
VNDKCIRTCNCDFRSVQFRNPDRFTDCRLSGVGIREDVAFDEQPVGFADPFFIHMPVGRRLPMYCTAAGRAYLSALPLAEAHAIVERSTLRRFTPSTLYQLPAILARISQARESGYSWANQEFYRGDLTIAAPILSEGGRPVAAINIAGTTSRSTLDELRQQFAPLLIAAARAASSSVAALRRR